ncbi:MAG: Aminomethyltransferase [Firmicutes bacterium]|nr:Aminomethyltransferase [Bacillota bacterium]
MPSVVIAGHFALVSRTGYTGEDGFEIYTSPEAAPLVWVSIMNAGRPLGLLPIGLGARDTLRFEANLPLYGHELSPEITPLEAGLSAFVKFNKGDFLGRSALQAQQNIGIPRELIGFTMIERGMPRSHYPVTVGGDVVGFVTSGGHSPSLKQNIGLALIERGRVTEGANLAVLVRDKPIAARRILLPFYRKRYKR